LILALIGGAIFALHIGWDDWFDAFDDNNLALLYQEQKSSGEDSTFFKLVSRNKSQ
jgi:hypothetical protein